MAEANLGNEYVNELQMEIECLRCEIKNLRCKIQEMEYQDETNKAHIFELNQVISMLKDELSSSKQNS